MNIDIIEGHDNDYAVQIPELLRQHNALLGYTSKVERFTIIAQKEGKFLGGAVLTTEWDYVYLNNLHVIEKGQGTGKKIVKEIEALTKKLNKKGIYLFTGEFQAVDFYKSLGFIQTGYIPSFVNENDEILMVKQLSKEAN